MNPASRKQPVPNIVHLTASESLVYLNMDLRLNEGLGLEQISI